MPVTDPRPKLSRKNIAEQTIGSVAGTAIVTAITWLALAGHWIVVPWVIIAAWLARPLLRRLSWFTPRWDLALDAALWAVCGICLALVYWWIIVDYLIGTSTPAGATTSTLRATPVSLVLIGLLVAFAFVKSILAAVRLWRLIRAPQGPPD